MMLPLLWSFFSQGSSSEELHTSAKILLHEALMLLRGLSHSLTSAICSSILSFSVHLFLIGFLVSCCAIFFTSGNCTHINYKNRTFCYTKVIVTKLLKKKNCCIYDGLWCLRHNAQVPISFQGYGASLLLGL
jgi:hypothetical protein